MNRFYSLDVRDNSLYPCPYSRPIVLAGLNEIIVSQRFGNFLLESRQVEPNSD